MLGMIDPGFDTTQSTPLIHLDRHAASGDDPTINHTLIYTEYPSGMGHSTVAMEWVTMTSGAVDWLFAHGRLPDVKPDINGDRQVGYSDLEVLTGQWLQTDCLQQDLCLKTDLNCDGFVNAYDLAILGEHWAQDTRSAPLAVWRFDERAGHIAYDSQGSHHAILIRMDADSWTTGFLGNALTFDGQDDYVTVPRFIQDDFTLCFWLRTTDVAKTTGRGAQWWDGKGLVDATVSDLASDFGATLHNDKFCFGVGEAGARGVTLISRSVVNDDVWHFLAVTRNSTTGEILLYVDSEEEAGANGPMGSLDAAPSITLGALQTGGPDTYFKGMIDEVSVYDRVLTWEELMLHMNGG